jgi:hypothetical protein
MSENETTTGDVLDNGLDFGGTPAPEPIAVPSLADEFAALDAEVHEAAPDGRFITLRVESGPAIYVPVPEGEAGLTIEAMVTARRLTLGPAVNFYVESQQVPMSTFVPAGSTVTAIGLVKGGK